MDLVWRCLQEHEYVCVRFKNGNSSGFCFAVLCTDRFDSMEWGLHVRRATPVRIDLFPDRMVTACCAVSIVTWAFAWQSSDGSGRTAVLMNESYAAGSKDSCDSPFARCPRDAASSVFCCVWFPAGDGGCRAEYSAVDMAIPKNAMEVA